MFGAINETTKLQSLSLGVVNLTGVDKDTLAAGINLLQSVELRAIILTDEQLNKMFGEIKETTKLQTLTLVGVKLSGVDKNTLAAGINQLQSVKMHYSCLLTDDQLNTMFGAINETTKLQSLSLGGINLRGVDKDILAAGINKLQSVKMHNSCLLTDEHE